MFRDRADAGRKLARLLEPYRPATPIVLALPRGGVPVGVEVAASLGVPLEVMVARKVGAPRQAELGLGAVAEGGALFLDPGMVEWTGTSDAELERVIGREAAEVERRVALYRRGRPVADVRGRTVILVDDGIATGGTVRAAIRALRSMRAGRIVVAAPVVAAESVRRIAAEADDLVYVEAPADLVALGQWYEDFSQLSDDEVIDALARGSAAKGPPDDPDAVTVPAGDVALQGTLVAPPDAKGVVLFAHGSGSGRLSPRNRFVAAELQRAGFATLLLDLLTRDEEARDAVDGELRFDIPFLARRLSLATNWVLTIPATRGLPIGYFGASTGAAAALAAAAGRPGTVAAVVSRGGRPDLADRFLQNVFAPTLLIVGERDYGVLPLNRRALGLIPAEANLAIVPGATHLFEEPGALQQVAALAGRWFERHLRVTERSLWP
jgi:putative phosphoribosyl transferase